MTIFEQSKSDAQRVPMFPATVIAAPGAEEAGVPRLSVIAWQNAFSAAYRRWC